MYPSIHGIQYWLTVAACSAASHLSPALPHEDGIAPSLDPPSTTTTQEQFLEWIKRDAIQIERWHMNPDLSRFLDQALEGKRILFIGEPGHFFSEKYDVQLLLIRYLATKGYNHIFLEGLGASMAPGIDRFVATGHRPGEDDRPTEISRYRERAFAGWVGADDPEFKRRKSAAQRRFYNNLHRISAALPDGQGPLRIHPLDIDMMPGGCYLSIASLLDQYAGDAALDPVRQAAHKQPQESPEQEVKRLEKLNTLVAGDKSANLAPMTPVDRARLRMYADCLLESTVFFDTVRADGNLTRALVRREPAMFRQVKHAMDIIPPNSKVIMIAHNNHLCRVGADIPRARKPSVGEMVAQAYPGQVFSIWMLHDHGTLLNPMSKELIDTLESDPRRIESTMIKAGSTYLLPLHSGSPGEHYLARARRHSYFTWDETSTLTRQTDALFFLDEVTPLAACP